MKGLELDRPLVFLDLETTGTRVGVDRIVQVGAVRHTASGKRTEWQTLVNPEMPVPATATAVHGITDEMVANAPTFAALASRLAAALEGADLAGFNVKRFDWPFLLAEFSRVGVAVEPKRRFVDVMHIFHRFERRDLSAAALLYLGTPHEGAHDALEDVKVTEAILAAQLEKHGDKLPKSVEALEDMLYPPEAPESFRFAFGKNKGKSPRDVDLSDLRWYEMAFRKSLSQPEKAQYREANERALEVVRAELRRRGEAANHD